MKKYCVNKNAQSNGDHEVHKTGECSQLPDPANRQHLGEFSSCRGAVAEAKKYYPKSNGCAKCCPACHTS